MNKSWKVLEAKSEYDIALERTIEIFHPDKNTHGGKELDLLLPLVIDYEDRHFLIPDPEPGSDK
jgi:HTH-type transcriptional regulator/antitoxin HigA